MKQLVSKLLIFCFAPLPFLYGLQLIVDSGLRKSSNRFYAEWNDIYNGTINADLLVMGSSRAREHISPTILDKNLQLNTYNLSLNGWRFPMQYERLKIYLKYNRKPRYIVQNVDLHMLSRNETMMVYPQFLPYLNDPDIQSATRGYEGEFGIAQFYLPMFKYNGNLDLAAEGVVNHFDLVKSEPVSYKGFEGQERAWRGSFEAFKKQFPRGITHPFDNQIAEKFRDYLAYCRQNNIKVVLVYTPEYVELHPWITNRDELMTTFEEISKEFDVPFLNYSNHPVSYNRDYFYNWEHLNKDGAELFSNILAQDLQNLGVR